MMELIVLFHRQQTGFQKKQGSISNNQGSISNTQGSSSNIQDSMSNTQTDTVVYLRVNDCSAGGRLCGSAATNRGQMRTAAGGRWPNILIGTVGRKINDGQAVHDRGSPKRLAGLQPRPRTPLTVNLPSNKQPHLTGFHQQQTGIPSGSFGRSADAGRKLAEPRAIS